MKVFKIQVRRDQASVREIGCRRNPAIVLSHTDPHFVTVGIDGSVGVNDAWFLDRYSRKTGQQKFELLNFAISPSVLERKSAYLTFGHRADNWRY